MQQVTIIKEKPELATEVLAKQTVEKFEKEHSKEKFLEDFSWDSYMMGYYSKVARQRYVKRVIELLREKRYII